jgi:nucleotide-binding universal stress UspA family protein
MSSVIERVVVPLDAASERRTAIETAARLAARTKARLHGVFVEDEDLLRLAGLPFARQVMQQAGAAPFTPDEAELSLRASAERSRAELLEAARRHHVESSFEIIRGGADAALRTAGERDLLVAGGQTRPIAGHFRVESRWWSSIEVASGPLLLARRDWRGGGSLLVVLRDLGPVSARLLDAAVRVAEARDAAVRIRCPSGRIDDAEFNNWIAARLQGHSVRLQIDMVSDGLSELQQRIAQLDCGLLAIEAGLIEGWPGGIREFIESFPCDVLIVR